jgi:large subunit ribosomal protein L35
MSKQKTRKAAAKRFKVTANGKIKRSSNGKRHLLSCKNSKRRRLLGKQKLVDPADMKKIRLCLPYA